MARDERGSAAAERFEDRLEPMVRTFEQRRASRWTPTASSTRVADPVRFDRAGRRRSRPRGDAATQGRPSAPTSRSRRRRHPRAAARGPGSRGARSSTRRPAQEAAVAARLPRPKPRAGLRALREVFESTTATIFWRGLWTLLGGLVILLWPGFPARLVTLAFAIWVFVLGFQTILGAVGLRRTGKGGWIPWLLIGALSAGVAIFLLAQPEMEPARDRDRHPGESALHRHRRHLRRPQGRARADAQVAAVARGHRRPRDRVLPASSAPTTGSGSRSSPWASTSS